MKAGLQLADTSGRQVEITTAGGSVLFRYVYHPDTPTNEAPRPYFHPVCSLAGDVLTNFRPNDHPWHHALSLTLTRVDSVNFWGGPSYRAKEGYRWRDDQGVQRHRTWTALQPDCLEEIVEWCAGSGGEVLLSEQRQIGVTVSEGAWSLRWRSVLTNVSGRTLLVGNYHSAEGLAGSHYTGLQFRGARDLLDEHGDAAIGITAETGLAGDAVHGAAARWMEWSCQHDGSLRRTRIRFENPDGPMPWFVRAKNPIAAFAFQREDNQPLPAGATLRLHHLLTFTNA